METMHFHIAKTILFLETPLEIMGCHGNHAFSHSENHFIFRKTVGNCPGSGARKAKLDAGVQVSIAVKVSL